MGEKPKRIPTSRDQRRPLLDAARAGKPDLIDRALTGLLEGHIEDIRNLCSREWGPLLQERIPGEGKTKVALLMDRLDAAQKALTSTRDAVAQASGVIAPQAAEPEKPDTPATEPSDADLKAELKAEIEAAERAAGLPPQQTPTHPSASAPVYTAPGPSRGTRATPAAPPTSTHVAEGMRRY